MQDLELAAIASVVLLGCIVFTMMFPREAAAAGLLLAVVCIFLWATS